MKTRDKKGCIFDSESLNAPEYAVENREKRAEREKW